LFDRGLGQSDGGAGDVLAFQRREHAAIPRTSARAIASEMTVARIHQVCQIARFQDVDRPVEREVWDVTAHIAGGLIA
jgi:hypothetical protein